VVRIPFGEKCNFIMRYDCKMHVTRLYNAPESFRATSSSLAPVPLECMANGLLRLGSEYFEGTCEKNEGGISGLVAFW